MTGNSNMATQVREHGEILARLVYIVEEDHRDLEELRKSTEIIAKAVAQQEDHDASRARFATIFAPILASILGVLAGHFIR